MKHTFFASSNMTWTQHQNNMVILSTNSTCAGIVYRIIMSKIQASALLLKRLAITFNQNINLVRIQPFGVKKNYFLRHTALLTLRSLIGLQHVLSVKMYVVEQPLKMDVNTNQSTPTARQQMNTFHQMELIIMQFVLSCSQIFAEKYVLIKSRHLCREKAQSDLLIDSEAKWQLNLHYVI